MIEREWAKNMFGSESLERVVRKFILLSSAVACTSLLMLGPAGADDFGGRSAGPSVERGAIDSAFHAATPCLTGGGDHDGNKVTGCDLDFLSIRLVGTRPKQNFDSVFPGDDIRSVDVDAIG